MEQILRHPDDIYPRGSTHMSVGSRVDVVTLRDQMTESCEILLQIFLQRWQGIRQGIRTRVLICSFIF